MENTFFIDILKYAGVSGLMFIVWLIYHKATIKAFQEMLSAQVEQEKRNHEILKDMIQANLGTIAALTRIEQKIDANAWCPYVKERMKGMEGEK